MPDPEFSSPDTLASIVLIGELLEELREAGLLSSVGKNRVLNGAITHLDLVGTRQSAEAANLIIDALGPEGMSRRDPDRRPS